MNKHKQWAHWFFMAGMLLLQGCAISFKEDEDEAFKSRAARLDQLIDDAGTLKRQPDWMVSKGEGIYKLGKPYKVNGIWYFPKEDYKYDEIGIASWYGPGFHAKTTANGETFDMDLVSAAHKTLPLPCVVRVTNLENGRSLLLRVNDRGPFVNDRIIDLSKKAADLLGFLSKGTAKVRVELMPEESMTVASLAQNKVYLKGASAQSVPLNGVAPVGSVSVSPAVANTAMDVPQTSAPQEAQSLSLKGSGAEQVPSGFSAVQDEHALGRTASHLEDPGMMTVGAYDRAGGQARPPKDRTFSENISRSLEGREIDQSPLGEQADGSTGEAQGPSSTPTTGAYVQVGAFGDPSNARRIAEKLAPVGDAEVTPVHVGAKTLYRVRFGPYADVSDAQKTFEQVAKTGHTDVKIIMP